MYNAKVLLSVAALVGVSRAQMYTDPVCNSSYEALLAAAPTPPPALISALGSSPESAALFNPDILGDPMGFTEELCSIAAELPASVLSDFGAWGSSLLSYASVEISSYDAFITQCVTTGEAAASLTSFINSIATATNGPLCPQITSAPGSGGASNSTITITSTPTAAPTNTYPAGSSSGSTSSSIPTAAAARPTGVFAGAAAMAGLLGAAALL
ncbi:hypothetical protein HD806DRAFT_458032 [Xylariaceae sp. AK1471]|nr:hypothetical protein HD806DRAFT_458032 [Xylariaceae sp. AK1471]